MRGEEDTRLLPETRLHAREHLNGLHDGSALQTGRPSTVEICIVADVAVSLFWSHSDALLQFDFHDALRIVVCLSSSVLHGSALHVNALHCSPLHVPPLHRPLLRDSAVAFLTGCLCRQLSVWKRVLAPRDFR